MTTYTSADQLLRPGEVGLFIFTEGDKFVRHADGSGSTGNWRLNPRRRFDCVIVYRRDRRNRHQNDLFRARPNGVDERSENGQRRYRIRLREIERIGRTDANWHDFASGSYPIRYVARD